MRGARFFLIARNEERLHSMAADLKVRGAHSTQCATLDVNDFDQHQIVLQRAMEFLQSIDIALIAHGTLGSQKACEADFNLALREINTNATSVISLLTHLANLMASQGHGTIVVITSVAGDRGRQSNYVYGTAKGALNIFLQGLRQRLFRCGVNVVTIKPGFVDTPMTKEFKKGWLWSAPEDISNGIIRSVAQRKAVVYLPRYWRIIMFVIRAIPEKLFRTMRL
jgi:short-subunit dehydrogenase